MRPLPRGFTLLITAAIVAYIVLLFGHGEAPSPGVAWAMHALKALIVAGVSILIAYTVATVIARLNP